MIKIILAIVTADAVEPVSRALVDKGFPVTQISSLGGFLRRGSTTMMIGVDESRKEAALQVIREAAAPFSKADSHAATLFVLNATEMIQS
jgi:uncharacterized protein YaaQ